MTEVRHETRAEHRARRRLERQSTSVRPRRGWLVWLAVIIVVGGGVTAWVMATNHQSSATTPDSVTGLTAAEQRLLSRCTTDMATQFHIHPHLSVVIDGQPRDIPAEVGIDSGCMRAIHTHDASGIMHIESPVKADFTLSGFFSVWREALTSTKVLDRTIDPAVDRVAVFVDGQEVTTAGQTVLRDKTSYAVVVGRKDGSLTPPANYDFSANL